MDFEQGKVVWGVDADSYRDYRDWGLGFFIAMKQQRLQSSPDRSGYPAAQRGIDPLCPSDISP